MIISPRTANEDLDLNTHEDDPNPWQNLRRYSGRKERDGSTPGSARRAHKTSKMKVPFDAKEGKHYLLRHLIMQEINIMRNDIETTLREEMKKEIEKQKQRCMPLSRLSY